MEKHTFLPVIHACDDFPYGPVKNEYFQLFLPNDSHAHGYMLPEIVEKMPWTSQFKVNHDQPRGVQVLDSSNGEDTAKVVNAAFLELIDLCIECDLFHLLDGRHSELFAVLGAQCDSPVWVERFATTLFGLTTRGVHMVAYTTSDTGIDKIWIPRRAAHLYSYPGMLDTTVAGGLKTGVAPLQAIVEEADEEASFDESFVRKHTRSRGVLSHMSLTGKDIPGNKASSTRITSMSMTWSFLTTLSRSRTMMKLIASTA